MHSATYRVTHSTTYAYASAVVRSQQLVRLAPRAHPRQRCLEHHLRVQPDAGARIDFADSFGNPVSLLEFDAPHGTLNVVSVLLVEVAPAPPISIDASPAWEDVAAQFVYTMARPLDDVTLGAYGYRFASAFVDIEPRYADYARACFAPRRPLLEGANALMRKIHDEFRFDPGSTQVGTPLREVLANRRGVCQDYAHLMLACLRSLGLAARYVSGYLLTRAPPGRPRLVGADASHAWVSVYCPRQGWIDFDPTNNVLPDTQHITLAWGRDFGDVSPQRGVILGSGSHTLSVGVTVEPV